MYLGPGSTTFVCVTCWDCILRYAVDTVGFVYSIGFYLLFYVLLLLLLSASFLGVVGLLQFQKGGDS